LIWHYCSMPMTLIATSDICVDHHRQGGRALIYTFTERTFRRLEWPGFGTQFLIKNGFDVVAVKTNRDLWYENLTASQLDVVASAGQGYSMRGTYGSSMGAYAAMRFARALGASRVLGLSPLFDIKAEFEKRWILDAAAMNAMPMMTAEHVNEDAEYFVVADPNNPDIAHVNLYRQLIPHLHFLPTPYSTHPSGYFLSEIQALP